MAKLKTKAFQATGKDDLAKNIEVQMNLWLNSEGKNVSEFISITQSQSSQEKDSNVKSEETDLVVIVVYAEVS